MIVKQNDRLKIMEIWLTRADQEDTALLECLKPKYAEWKQQGILPVVYRSGTESLFDCTLDLLKYNRKLSAQREVQNAKRSGA